MYSPCIRDGSQSCSRGCCPVPFLGLPEPPKPNLKPSNTVAASRYNFATVTTSSLFPNIQFTNHESLPSSSDSFSHFNKAYPDFSQTHLADRVRAQEYYHLSISNRVCLDYIGLGLFSYSQQQAQYSSAATIASSSSSPPPPPPPPPPHNSQFPFFDISYKSTSLISEIAYGGKGSVLESSIRKRIMGFLNISESDYSMVFTANRTSAFKLLADSYPFQSNPRLLTVYDYESEAVDTMIDSSQKRGARVMSAEFSWPGLRVHSAKLTKMVASKRKKKRGLFVFPLQSCMTGTRYPYLWMNLAQENGWHVLLDICALGPKDMDTLGLSLFRPDFLICSFFKIFGENPAGFACLFVKRSSASLLKDSTAATGIGIVSLVPAKRLSQLTSDYSGTEMDTQQSSKFWVQEDDSSSIVTNSFSGPISAQQGNEEDNTSLSSSQRRQIEVVDHGKTLELSEKEAKHKEPLSNETVESGNPTECLEPGSTETSTREMDRSVEIECKGLDHADSIGLIHISTRARYLINWLVNALMKLKHPHSEDDLPLIRIYGPKIKFDRGPALAFNVFDWKGEKVDPVLVQKLADRSNISVGYGFLHNIWFSDKYEEEKEKVLETRTHGASGGAGNKRKEKSDLGITVVTAAFSFLANFEDTYRLWVFVAQFLDADFVEKERWRYMALNQKTIEI
ncbi:PREDICTED: uncharacterized protein LOC104596201 [Nelumbo nucifera]|uniref:Uncharacterized protein LOC104596201 n=1 Tax=Nelumbo nucifera TaxID=4432 RepID=A0A1U7ZTX3_NELNU|nr:PREDICTED: uncharacterized protein LOC104596201 [Nelumbo nucifera]